MIKLQTYCLFPLDDEFQIHPTMLGDVVINTKRVLEQAEEFGHSNEREIAYLTVHSTLHLLGYDHMEDDEKKRNERNRRSCYGANGNFEVID